MSLVAQQLSEEYPTDDKGLGINLIPLRDAQLRGIGSGLSMLWLAVAAVLLTACLNLVHLSLARAMRRHKEIAIRIALGASRGQITRQFILDGMLLGVVGGFLGLIIAFWGLHLILEIAPPLPQLTLIRIDNVAIMFACLVSVTIALLVSLFPCLHLVKFNLCAALKDAGPAMGNRRFHGGNLRKSLITIQVAMALTLSIGGALL